jgi:hypothetical protein
MTGHLQLAAEVREWAVFAGFWCAVAFPFAVGSFWRWWRTVPREFGLALMGFDAILMVVFAPYTVSVLTGEQLTATPALLWAQALADCLLAPGVLMLGWVLWRMQRKGRRR